MSYFDDYDDEEWTGQSQTVPTPAINQMNTPQLTILNNTALPQKPEPTQSNNQSNNPSNNQSNNQYQQSNNQSFNQSNNQSNNQTTTNTGFPSNQSSPSAMSPQFGGFDDFDEPDEEELIEHATKVNTVNSQAPDWMHIRRM